MLININLKYIILSIFRYICHGIEYTKELEELRVFEIVTIVNKFNDYFWIYMDHHSLDLRLIGKRLLWRNMPFWWPIRWALWRSLTITRFYGNIWVEIAIYSMSSLFSFYLHCLFWLKSFFKWNSNVSDKNFATEISIKHIVLNFIGVFDWMSFWFLLNFSFSCFLGLHWSSMHTTTVSIHLYISFWNEVNQRNSIQIIFHIWDNFFISFLLVKFTVFSQMSLERRQGYAATGKVVNKIIHEWWNRIFGDCD